MTRSGQDTRPPLEQWRDVEGSNLGPRDYVRAAVDLMRIYRRHLRA
jgi:hypothetical protein